MSNTCWVFRIDADVEHDLRAHLPPGWNEEATFADAGGTVRLVIRADGVARVPAGYAWDGCTPKYCVCDIAVGIPDGVPNRVSGKPKAYYASLWHDVLYQFLDAGLPMGRRDADLVFLELLTRDGFAPRTLYHRAVRAFGGVFRLFTRWKRGYGGARRLPAPRAPVRSQ
jgi:hypothetical protein